MHHIMVFLVYAEMLQSKSMEMLYAIQIHKS